jgi:hypothetical protein
MRCGWRGGGLVWGGVAALVAGVGLWCPAAWADDGEPPEQPAGPARFEVWSGAQAVAHAWSLYGGATVALGGLQNDGLRLRAASGYGVYSYTTTRAVGLTSEAVRVHGMATFTDLLVGYHKQLGPVTVKAFAGLMQADHRLNPDDPETSIRGAGFGGKVALETWWTIGDRAWSSLDLAWGSLHDTYNARARLGWRLLPALSVGLEAGAAGNVEGDSGRVGGFLRYEWAGGEVSLSGGASSDKLLDDFGGMATGKSSVPFATFSWLTRF